MKAKIMPFSPQWLPRRTKSRVSAVSRNAVLRVFIECLLFEAGFFYFFISDGCGAWTRRGG